MHPVRRLDPILVDRIAAGEVIERPAAAVKELVENAIDAGARHIAINIEAGGRKLIRVTDDGSGMSEADLALAVERHATSKLPDGDLFDIRSLGFRGEALPSIGAVARLAITTRRAGDPQGALLVVEAGQKSPVRPASATTGTRIEVSELFAFTPARLKFLKGDRAEAQAVAEMVKRLAIAHPEIRFALTGDHVTGFDYAVEGEDEGARLARLARIMGRDFPENAMAVAAEREGLRLSGHAGLPTFHRGTSAHIHMAVNGRPVRDKLLLSAVRGGYADVLPSDRHPALFLNLDCDPRSVDVNVHPAKTEVRFRDPALVRGLVVTALREAIARAGHRAATTGGLRTLEAMRATFTSAPGHSDAQQNGLPFDGTRPGGSGYRPSAPRWNTRHTDWQAPLAWQPPAGDQSSHAHAGLGEAAQAAFHHLATPSAEAFAHYGEPAPEALDRPLGAARAQVHENYIIAQTRDGMVIVDQHAAHERLVYERLKRERAANGIARQMLLVPEVVELDPVEADRVAAASHDLAGLGLVVEPFGAGAVLVREAPVHVAGGNLRKLVTDIADALAEHGDIRSLEKKLDHVLATIACHNSVRSGRRLRPEEMDALLREMEVTPNAGQCNHGRPTYVELKLGDIERLFGRK